MITVTVQGNCNDYKSGEKQNDLIENMALMLGVSMARIHIDLGNCPDGSRLRQRALADFAILIFGVRTASAEEAARTKDICSSALDSAAKASSALSVSVLETPSLDQPCFPVPEGQSCSDLTTDDKTLCELHFALTASGELRRCEYDSATTDDKCGPNGQPYDEWPACSASPAPAPPAPPAVPPPPPAVPPGFCYTSTAVQGVDWCYLLNVDHDMCSSYFQVNSQNGQHKMCQAGSSLSWGRCRSGDRLSAQPSPLCDDMSVSCFSDLQRVGLDWCFQLPNGASCNSYYVLMESGKYVRCRDGDGGRCTGGGGESWSPPSPQCSCYPTKSYCYQVGASGAASCNMYYRKLLFGPGYRQCKWIDGKCKLRGETTSSKPACDV